MSTNTQNQTTIDPAATLDTRFKEAIHAAVPDLPQSQIQTHITASRQPKFGDFQSNCAMPIAKRFKMQPRELAAKIIEHLDVSGVAEPITDANIAGPGFINVTLLPDAISESLGAMDNKQLGIVVPDSPPTVVVDVCGVNLAKQMHVGHLRSTVIGDAIARLYERMGYKVIRQSHVGDWGLPIAMVVEQLITIEDAGEDLSSLTLSELNSMYKKVQAACKAETKALELIQRVGGHAKAEIELNERIADANASLEKAKSRLVALQSGDERSVQVWQRIYDITMNACLSTCKRLHTKITDEHSAGESTYRDELAPLVQDLIDRKIAIEDEGALVVQCDGIKEPTIIRKRDGGFLYATTDLAAIKRRVSKLGGDIVVYCVDSRQSLHFKQVFAAAHKAGYDKTQAGNDATLVHAMFGTVLGDDNKPLKSRSGENLNLTDLLDEAVARASATVAEKNPDMSESDRADISEAVAMAAVKYADLSTERIKDYVMNFDRMLAFEGDTGPYLLYAVVRIRSIFRKANELNIDLSNIESAPFNLNEPSEKALALMLLRYPSLIKNAGQSCEPNRLCSFVYDLASAYSAFFDKCPVLKNNDEQVRASRLRLCDLTGRVLTDALDTLGIPTVERM
ncbi:MAG: arginine--tRNA ligase [Phycisphaerales bacterium]|nr:arginine--tRNA ligase [Phycisphaerales bacterium]